MQSALFISLNECWQTFISTTDTLMLEKEDYFTEGCREVKLRAVSGAMLTLLFLGVPITAFNFQPAKADQGPQLLLETDKNLYILGKNVTIILSNIGTETIEIGRYPIWEIHAYPEEEPVYPSVFAFLAWSLEPGENDTITWNQTNQFTHSPVEAGMYVVRDSAGWGLSAYFEIVPLPGDATGDGYVNIWDLGLLSDAWLTMSGEPDFDSNCDFNWDDVINIWDLGIISDHWLFDGDEWVSFIPSSEMVSLVFWMLDGISYVNATITFPNNGYDISCWGTVVREGQQIWVDACIHAWTIGFGLPYVMELSHTYNLGNLEQGDYTFTFKAWNTIVKSIDFNVG